MRTTLGICTRKVRYLTEQDARDAAGRTGLVLRPYRCELCRQFHLTSRTKGMRIPRPAD